MSKLKDNTSDELDRWKPIFINGVIPKEFRYFLTQKVNEAERRGRVEAFTHVSTMDENSHRDDSPYMKIDSRRIMKEIAALQSAQNGSSDE